MQEKQIPLETFFGNDVLEIPFRIYEMKVRQTPSPLDPHRHDFYEIFIFNEGHGSHHIDFRAYAVNRATLHFVGPGQVHWLKRSLDSNGYMIAFSRAFFSQSDSADAILNNLPFFHSSYAPTLTLSRDDFKRVTDICGQLFEEMKRKEKGKADVLRAYFKILLIACQRVLEDDQSQNDIKKPQNKESEFLRFKHLVEAGFHKHHQVKDYTKQIGCSHQTINDIVRKAIGQTALEYIHGRILLEAKRLLFFSDNSIKEVAYTLNFEDPSNFSKFFKRKTGITPLQFKALTGINGDYSDLP